jgi:hypothetical protein
LAKGRTASDSFGETSSPDSSDAGQALRNAIAYARNGAPTPDGHVLAFTQERPVVQIQQEPTEGETLSARMTPDCQLWKLFG